MKKEVNKYKTERRREEKRSKRGDTVNMNEVRQKSGREKGNGGRSRKGEVNRQKEQRR